MNKTESKLLHKRKLRNNEYYNMQNVYDGLYKRSLNKGNFKKIYTTICCRENILLAYRNIKKNSGSTTAGTDGRTITDIENLSEDELINLIRTKLDNFNPGSVRRVYIEKDNGKKRPLGIPIIEDRIIQQCMLQVLEPICEGKFYKYSFGFRPNRSAKHAIARTYSLAQINNLHYCIDVDLKGFFDNVNHGKLLKQMWSIGIRDKKVLSIVSKMLKAEIEGEGQPEKGTPQGGILSPLLANIVLNEFDWWVSSQWDNMKTDFNYKQKGNMHVALRNTNLKEMQLVRYADDFKIFCKSERDATKIFHAVKSWLEDRLGLEINKDKSKIVNLRKEYSEFLGIRFKVKKKGNKWTVSSKICTKAFKKIVSDIKHLISNKIRKFNWCKFPRQLNSMIVGWHNYYSMATNVSQDFALINHRVHKALKNKKIRTKEGHTSNLIKIRYKNYRNRKKIYLHKIEIVPISGVKFVKPMNLGVGITNYTPEGREKIHKSLSKDIIKNLVYIMKYPNKNYSIEFNDNRISRYSGQQGKCGITKRFLNAWEMECHHIKPRNLGGTDKYDNLLYIDKRIHKLIHCGKRNIISKYLTELNLTVEEVMRVNKLRKLALKEEIIVNNYI